LGRKEEPQRYAAPVLGSVAGARGPGRHVTSMKLV